MNITKYRLTIGALIFLLTFNLGIFAQTNNEKPASPASDSTDKSVDTTEKLVDLGNYYLNEGQQTKAVECFAQALSQYKSENNLPGQAKMLFRLGYVYTIMGQNNFAIEHYKTAIDVSIKRNNNADIASALMKIGYAHLNSGNYDEAFQLFEKSMMKWRELDGYRSLEAEVFNYIGLAYDDLGQYEKALENYEKAIEIVGELSKNEDELSKNTNNYLTNKGVTYQKLGSYDKAVELLEKALASKEKYKDPNLEWTLLNLAFVYTEIGRLKEAETHYRKVLPMLRKSNNGTFLVITLNGYGKMFYKRQEYDQAIAIHNQALELTKHLKLPIWEADALYNLGQDYLSRKNFEIAGLNFEQAAAIYRRLKRRGGETNALAGLMQVWNERKQGPLAVVYGKQAVNILQNTRRDINKLDKKIQSDFLRDNEKIYRYLADILAAEGRFFEAQQILAMLKEDEYFDYVRRDADEIKKLSARIGLLVNEKAALIKYEQLAGKLTEYGTQFTELEELKNKQGADFKKQADYDDLKAKLDAANAAFRIFLEKELAAELGKSVKKEIEIDRALQTKLQQWGNGTVALYTVAGDERYRVILTTPKTQIDGKTEIKIADLNKKIFEFRAALQNPSVDPRPLGKELYDILIKPIEKDLLASEAKTLLWSLDGTLRYIPFAALSPDGKTYLAEKYQNVMVTSTTRQSLLAETNPNWRLLGAGVSKESRLMEPNGTGEITFSALPGVRSELVKIVSSEDAKPQETGLLTGRRLIDEGFNLPALENGMSQRAQAQKPKYNVIHLATHFRLGGDTAKSFLLLGGNQALTLEKVSDSTLLNFGDVELVTLSACNTGFGTAIENKAAGREQERRILEQNNGIEVDSLATFIELRGAKAIMATLWSVADESTALLMSEFYRLKKENPQMTKAEAIQSAQKAMIEGRLKSSGGSAGCRSEIVNLEGTKQPPFKCDTSAPYSHPYFWSPFVLIGNWR